MENLKKAKEIACMIEEDLMESSHMTRSDIELVGEYAQGAAMRMAQWKDEQFNYEKSEMLGLVNLLECNERNQTIIENLKGLLSL